MIECCGGHCRGEIPRCDPACQADPVRESAAEAMRYALDPESRDGYEGRPEDYPTTIGDALAALAAAGYTLAGPGDTVVRQGRGAALIATERARQIEAEGYTLERDDQYDDAELIHAALWYLGHGSWPEGWSPRRQAEDPVERLTKAGALLAAEIDRRLRATPDAAGAGR